MPELPGLPNLILTWGNHGWKLFASPGDNHGVPMPLSAIPQALQERAVHEDHFCTEVRLTEVTL